MNVENIRLVVFLGMLLVIAVWELAFPRRKLTNPKTRRWLCNLLLVFIDTLLLRLALPLAVAGLAAMAAGKGWGLFNMIGLPAALEIVLAVVLLEGWGSVLS